ncbi:MAG: hypothetical protein ACLR1I_08780 [Ruminococcus sp.]
MQRKEFLEKTVIQLDDDLFGEFKKLIVGKYISFSFIKKKVLPKKRLQKNYLIILTRKKARKHLTHY